MFKIPYQSDEEVFFDSISDMQLALELLPIRCKVKKKLDDKTVVIVYRDKNGRYWGSMKNGINGRWRTNIKIEI